MEFSSEGLDPIGGDGTDDNDSAETKRWQLLVHSRDELQVKQQQKKKDASKPVQVEGFWIRVSLRIQATTPNAPLPCRHNSRAER